MVLSRAPGDNAQPPTMAADMPTETPAATVTRFAPSPTGHLHLGHAYSALFAEAKARAAPRGKGRFLLRIEDIDRGRARAEFEAAIFEDLAWLGLRWETPVRRQSEHFQDYEAQLARLEGMGLLYPCFCTRREIRAEIEAAGLAPHVMPAGPDGPLYPGTCRNLSEAQRARKEAEGRPFALRLDAAGAARAVRDQGALTWTDARAGTLTADPALFGDVVLARKETPASYHLASTVDDHLQGVTLVTRGEDLLPATHVHRVLQALLGYSTPAYHHHRLLVAEDGRRLAKRDQEAGKAEGLTGTQQEAGTGAAAAGPRRGNQGPQTIRALRDAGHSPEDVRRMAGFDGDGGGGR